MIIQTVPRLIAILIIFLAPLPCPAAEATLPSGAAGSKDTIIAVVPEDLPPTYFRDPVTGKATGFAVDVMNEVARNSGLKVAYVFAKPWDEMIEMVRSGKADVIPHLTPSPEREKLLDFTIPIEVVPVGLTVTTDSKVTGFAPGLKVVTLRGSLPEKHMRTKEPAVAVIVYDEMMKVLFSLLSGEADAAFVLNPNLMKLAIDAGVDDKLKVLSPPVYEAKRGIAVRKDAPGLCEQLNRSVKQFIGTPAYASLFTKWYGKPQQYWTTIRTAYTLGGILLFAVMGLLYWRYHSVARLSRKVAASADALQATFDSVNDAIFIHDLTTGAILDVNRKMCEMYGYTYDEALQLTVENLSSGAPPYAQADAVARIRKAAGGEPQLFEWHARRKDGSLFWVEVNMRTAAIGGKDRVIVAVRDITERRKAEADLRTSAMQLRANLENTPNVAIQWYDEAGKVLYWNPASETMYGWKAEEAIGKTLDELIYTPEVTAEFLHLLAEIGATGKPVGPFESTFRKRNGSEGWLMSTTFSMPMADGKIGFVCMDVDITERKRAEEELRNRQAKLEAIFRSATVGIGETRNRTFIFVNPRFCQMFGYREEELVGQPARMLFASDEDFRKSADAVASLYTKDSPGYATYEVEGCRKDGAELQVYVSTAPLDKKDPEAGTLFTVLDITERKRLETELNQAQKMEAIGALAGGVAHDFNNILSAITGFASLLQMKLKADDQLRQYAGQILQSSERAAALTKTLLSFSRKEKPDLKPVDANAIVGGFQKILARLIREDIEFTMNIFPEALNVKADKGQVEQVLMNLAANARDAMPKGGKLSVSTERVVFPSEHGDLPSGAYALISVSDTGSGMDKKTQEHIFEPFFTTKEVGKGTGLGLSIVYSIVKNHGGSIHVYSEPGMGTTFKVMLPLLDAAAVREHEREEQQALPTGTETILLAEDDESARQVAKMLLEEFGYRVYEARDGEEAVSIFREKNESIHLVLTDLIMPRKNGREAYEEMKKLRPDVKVVFMSGYSRDIITQKDILDEGMSFISKPLTPTALLTSVRTTLRK